MNVSSGSSSPPSLISPWLWASHEVLADLSIGSHRVQNSMTLIIGCPYTQRICQTAALTAGWAWVNDLVRDSDHCYGAGIQRIQGLRPNDGDDAAWHPKRPPMSPFWTLLYYIVYVGSPTRLICDVSYDFLTIHHCNWHLPAGRGHRNSGW